MFFVRAVTIITVLTLFLSPYRGYCEKRGVEQSSIQDEIEASKEKLKKATLREKSVLAEIERTNRELVRTKQEIKSLKQQTKDIENSIKQLSNEIEENHKATLKYKALLKRRFQMIQRYGRNFDQAILLLSVGDFYKILRLNKYLAKVSGAEYKRMLHFKEIGRQLKEKETRLKGLLVELRGKNEKTKIKKKTLTAKKKRRHSIFLSVKKEQILYRSMLKELEATSKGVRRIIKDSVEPEPKVANAAVKKKRVNFKILKGSLRWPVRGKLAIPYGSHQDPTFKTPVFRNGIYIRSREEAVVKAVYGGKVVFADWFKGLGQVVIVNHGGGYHSVYANLSQMNAEVGSKVNKMEKIGNAGDSGVIDGAGIYFELRYKGKPVNPLMWLSKK